MAAAVLGGRSAHEAKRAALAKEDLPADPNALNGLSLVDRDPTRPCTGTRSRRCFARAVAMAKEGSCPIPRHVGVGAVPLRADRRSTRRTVRALEEAKAQPDEVLSASLKQVQEMLELWTASMRKEWKRSTHFRARPSSSTRSTSDGPTNSMMRRIDIRELAQLVSDLKAFSDEKSGGLDTDGTSSAHG
jgi:hypothetical protein